MLAKDEPYGMGCVLAKDEPYTVFSDAGAILLILEAGELVAHPTRDLVAATHCRADMAW
jgi:hypothetical protein